MRTSLSLVLLLCLLPAGISAEESAGTQPETGQVASPAKTAPVVQQAPLLSAENQKLHEKLHGKHPRLFWIFPTYTVVDSKSTSPLTARGKWQLFMKDKTDPFTFGWVAFEAGLAQANNDFSAYGQGAAGYGKRFGAGLADETSSAFFGIFLFPSALHQDPRYYRLGAGPFTKRFGRALIGPISTHRDSGGRTFNWAGILSSTARSGLSNAYYPKGHRGAGATFSRVAIGIPFSMLGQLFNEFGPDVNKKIFRKK